MSTPLTFEDLKVFENVFAVDTSSVGIQTEAARIFNEKFGEDLLPDQITTRFLFAGDDSEGNQVKVYEAYNVEAHKIYLTATL